MNDSARQAVRQTVIKEYQRWQDSMRAVRIKQNVQKNGKPLDAFLRDMEDRNRAQRNRSFVRLGLGLLFLTVLGVLFIRGRRKG